MLKMYIHHTKRRRPLVTLCLLLSVLTSSASLAADNRYEAGLSSASDSLLSVDFLLSDQPLVQPLSMAAFTAPLLLGQASSANLSGRLQFKPWLSAGKKTAGATSQQARLDVLRDDYDFAAQAERRLQNLPTMSVEVLQVEGALIPVVRGPVRSDHPHWEYSVEPGVVWHAADDGGYSRASLPFTLREKNANCSHNGVMSFVFRQAPQGSDVPFEISSAVYQVASETCMYLKFNAWGRLRVEHEATVVESATALRDRFTQEQANRLPQQSIETLLKRYPNLFLKDFDQREHINTEHLSAYGVVVDGVHYVSGCPTRAGAYPFCDVMLLPSYSLAKSFFAGLALMRLESAYRGTRHEKIVDYVPECKAAGHWGDVTFEQALNMVTGVHNSLDDRADEFSVEMDQRFFFAESHADKINYACSGLKQKIPAGERWVYHTSDTYVLMTAMDQFLKNQHGAQADIYRDVFADSHRLALSPVAGHTMRTYDERLQSLGGFGLSLYRDDIARLAQFINGPAANADWLDSDLYRQAMQRNLDDLGYQTADFPMRYQQGFWTANYASLLGCEQDVWVPQMIGYGGITVLLFANDMSFYLFSDGGEFNINGAVKVAHTIAPLCSQ